MNDICPYRNIADNAYILLDWFDGLAQLGR